MWLIKIKFSSVKTKKKNIILTIENKQSPGNSNSKSGGMKWKMLPPVWNFILVEAYKYFSDGLEPFINKFQECGTIKY